MSRLNRHLAAELLLKAVMERTNDCCIRNSSLPFFLTGLGTGVALALLLAPRSGAATRSLITGKVSDGTNWVKDKATEAVEKAQAQGATLRDGLMEKVEKVQAQGTAIRDGLMEKVEKVQAQGTAVRDGIKEAAAVIARS